MAVVGPDRRDLSPEERFGKMERRLKLVEDVIVGLCFAWIFLLILILWLA